ncbi:Na-translocating system protein MpsC family protein [Planococcus sp. YIM B11945]|uniref:Na-translocating system protein MpsC family protein n=1 Tax=Planococcus sp. YIM B11945 TaxID=3435410 RepID=UPI003D7CE9E4
MENERKLQIEVGSYISGLLRTYFGKGPKSVYVAIKSPYIIMHFRDFVTPMDKFLLQQNETKRILETREMLMENMKKEVVDELWEIGELNVTAIYSDWNLENKTGIIIGKLDGNEKDQSLTWPKDLDEEAFRNQLIEASILSEKSPEDQEIYWLDHRTILVQRSNILLPIEKELINNGHAEELKRAKWELEQKILSGLEFEDILKRPVSEAFLDWDFAEDVGYIVFIVKS